MFSILQYFESWVFLNQSLQAIISSIKLILQPLHCFNHLLRICLRNNWVDDRSHASRVCYRFHAFQYIYDRPCGPAVFQTFDSSYILMLINQNFINLKILGFQIFIKSDIQIEISTHFLFFPLVVDKKCAALDSIYIDTFSPANDIGLSYNYCKWLPFCTYKFLLSILQLCFESFCAYIYCWQSCNKQGEI